LKVRRACSAASVETAAPGAELPFEFEIRIGSIENCGRSGSDVLVTLTHPMDALDQVID
jgi:hypothetical protein